MTSQREEQGSVSNPF